MDEERRDDLVATIALPCRVRGFMHVVDLCLVLCQMTLDIIGTKQGGNHVNTDSWSSYPSGRHGGNHH